MASQVPSDSAQPTDKSQPEKPAMSGNLHSMILNRNKKPLSTKNNASQVASTPANIKRLQVNKWFNSPTDNMFSPCSKKLYKKNYQPVHLIDEINAEENLEKVESHVQDDQ